MRTTMTNITIILILIAITSPVYGWDFHSDSSGSSMWNRGNSDDADREEQQFRERQRMIEQKEQEEYERGLERERQEHEREMERVQEERERYDRERRQQQLHYDIEMATQRYNSDIDQIHSGTSYGSILTKNQFLDTASSFISSSIEYVARTASFAETLGSSYRDDHAAKKAVDEHISYEEARESVEEQYNDDLDTIDLAYAFGG